MRDTFCVKLDAFLILLMVMPDIGDAVSVVLDGSSCAVAEH